MRERETVTHGASPSWRRVLAQDRRGGEEKKKRRGVWWIGVSSFLGTRLYIVHVYFLYGCSVVSYLLPCVTAIRGGKTPTKRSASLLLFFSLSNSLFTNGAACTIFDRHIIIAINKITTTTAAPKRCIFLPNNRTPGLFPPFFLWRVPSGGRTVILTERIGTNSKYTCYSFCFGRGVAGGKLDATMTVGRNIRLTSVQKNTKLKRSVRRVG